MLCYPNSSTGGVFCVPGSVSLEQNNPELVLCHGTQEHLHGVSCRKKNSNSNLFMDIPRPLAKPRGVDKALEVLQVRESHNGKY